MPRIYAAILALFLLVVSSVAVLTLRGGSVRPINFAPLVFDNQNGLGQSIPRFPLFLIYQQNVGMLRNAFQSAQEAFPGQIVIIDNSEDTELSRHPDFQEVAAYYHTVTLLSFPQLMNLLAALSKAWGFDYFGWMHSDGVVLRKDTSEDIGAVVQSKLQGMGSSSWGVAFTYYDILAFYNTKVVLEHPWDENYLQNYMADCDVYHRWRLAGYSTDKLAGIDKHIQLVHMGSVPEKSWAKMTPTQRQETFPSLEKKLLLVDANFWKQQHTSTRSTISQAGRYNAAFQYFEAKWGGTVSEMGCQVGDLSVKPRFEVAPSALHSSSLAPASGSHRLLRRGPGFKPAVSRLRPAKKAL
eukprot:CAMPEP_0202344760 /NCGR_PEP_ID=MMETSP1126-20121109/4299_1 /ASSEMBLY_ACC=CAM_ASM_000457 /TAXON_ID=3047 /ORGANISM="Dunaliella tertiolecta, Strain CCMP1320" /LENGTH=353 /DNA_ID=CAMNT_0048935987 /DNA_START=11 /DNA_END=1072 /DNA_ORIENTATION=+